MMSCDLNFRSRVRISPSGKDDLARSTDLSTGRPGTFRRFPVRTTLDRIRQALAFEILGILIVTPLFSWLFDHGMAEIGVLAIISGTLATLWNYLFNLGFDHALLRWRGTARKTLPLRIAHAALFELSFMALLLPVVAWWLGISLLAALLLDLSFAVFYLGYTFVFTLGYDRLYPPEAPQRA